MGTAITLGLPDLAAIPEVEIENFTNIGALNNACYLVNI